MAFMAAVVALAVGAQASANSLLQLAYNSAKVYGAVDLGGTGSNLGAIDLTNGAMIVTTSAFAFIPNGNGSGSLFGGEKGTIGVIETGDNAIHDAIEEGWKGGAGVWSGSNGITSSILATSTTANLDIAWADAAYNSNLVTHGFRGVPVNSSQSVITFDWVGDADLNGLVNFQDYSLWLNGKGGHYANSVNAQWADGDFDYNGLVNFQDYSLWLNGKGVGTAAPWPSNGPIVPAEFTSVSYAASNISPVPEPASLALVLAAAGLFAFRRSVKKLFA